MHIVPKKHGAYRREMSHAAKLNDVEDIENIRPTINFNSTLYLRQEVATYEPSIKLCSTVDKNDYRNYLIN